MTYKKIYRDYLLYRDTISPDSFQYTPLVDRVFFFYFEGIQYRSLCSKTVFSSAAQVVDDQKQSSSSK